LNILTLFLFDNEFLSFWKILTKITLKKTTIVLQTDIWQTIVTYCSHLHATYTLVMYMCNVRLYLSILIRSFYFQNLPKLCSEVAQCISAFCVDFWLQTNLFQSGVLWHLLLYLFNYDYTLEEGGVEKSGESNQQVIKIIRL
jgi:hypothetical protein